MTQATGLGSGTVAAPNGTDGTSPLPPANIAAPNGDGASPLPDLPIIDASFAQSLIVKPTVVSVERNDDLTGATISRVEKDRYMMIKDEVGWHLGPVVLLENRQDKKWYIVHPSIRHTLPENTVREYRLYAAIDDTGKVFLWPVSAKGQPAYADSVLKAVDSARKGWTKIIWNQPKGGYDVFEPVDEMPEPLWPRNITSFEQILAFALRDAVITDVNHLEIRRLGRKK